MRLKLVPNKTTIDFFAKIKFIFSISLFAAFLSLILFFVFGLNYGIDFRGGTMLMVQTKNEVSISYYRDILQSADVGDTSVSEISDPGSKISSGMLDKNRHIFLIRIEQAEGEDSIQNESIIKVKDVLSKQIPNIQFLQTESVGAKVSKELVRKGLISVILAVSAVLFYIWIRFEWQFAIGAVFALVHDVAITVGIFSVLGLEFNLSIIAALLTIVGYSLNDTVIVFDRIRENLKKFRKKPLLEVLNLSVNETLSRTVMTSVTTLLALSSLYILGGDVIRGFTFAMIWGVLIGTFSSIFVASASLFVLGVKRDWSKANTEAGTQFTNSSQ
ncbi:MAG: protein translocase subunit SecF [Rhodobacteraceae bacterium]|nr:MAG: protein translocase subunit SecF [Paracoccaceae bacterium]|tara:strand:- start:1028 stop:2017 length:990 start_codon:yes stop_codon:yes gene_type:complete